MSFWGSLFGGGSEAREKAKMYEKLVETLEEKIGELVPKINDAMDLIRCNATHPAYCKWITLTYADTMTDMERAMQGISAGLGIIGIGKATVLLKEGGKDGAKIFAKTMAVNAAEDTTVYLTGAIGQELGLPDPLVMALMFTAGSTVSGLGMQSIENSVKMIDDVDCTLFKGGSKTGTVWDNITPTQENYPYTNIPKSFEIEVNGEKMWVHGNATEHMYEDVYKGITTGNGTAYTNPNLYTQEIMSDFYGSLQEATKSGIIYGEKITQGNWEFIFAQPRQAGQLPVIKHAQFNGWH
ncbi:MAG: hypothetical protein PUD93_11960 [Lachnospiraceae bacterium]|nr:hypothetical protein [Lachnospiraceae bacterium]